MCIKLWQQKDNAETKTFRNRQGISGEIHLLYSWV